jgi:hypothetical protein
MKRFFALGAVVFGIASWCKTAMAQDQLWLGDRRYREGAGFRVGDFELHPGVAADFGYDSNYFLRHADEDPIGSLRIRATPSFSVATLGPQRLEGSEPPSVAFRFDLSGTYNEYIPVSGSDAGKDALQQQRNMGGDARLSLDILPDRPWGGRIFGGVSRSVRPTNEGDPTTSFNRIAPQGGAELAWRPGSGLLDWRLGYEFNGTFFESGNFAGLNNFRNDVTTRGRWRFLPRTAMLYDARLGFTMYPGGGSATNKTDSHPMRARLGANGLITPTFAMLAMVGWGSSYYSADDQDFDSVIGQLELKWYLMPTESTDSLKATGMQSSVAVGFSRDYEDSYIGTYLERDEGYARFNYLFGGTFLFVVDARAGAVVFPKQTLPDLGQPGGWTDMRVVGKLFGEYRIKDQFGIDAEVGYTGYFSSTSLVFPNVPGSDKLGYHDITAFVGARWLM